ncbi:MULTISPECIES: MFS transporter [Streptomyces]|uniref:MFS transporter n=1 Tax=Streptomyces evansiae TaxID=3075535 RepID=A0ABU2QTK1_9ACTN|nr:MULTISPECIES: MFS transporter [unclassified Streptomyces]MDT0407758.1 MFS transporter [Streptomyces sp. DSM 41979]MYQ60920.1 MFS transporter [Streptomyces sp. SID4926]SCE59478.1 Major Facilitator Superfamily protein [Streptomyces sp. DfronAA-171]
MTVALPSLSRPRLYAVRGTDALASALITYAIPLLVLLTTGSPALTGLVFAVEWTPRIAAFGIAGGLADRYGPARVLRWGNLVRAGCLCAAAAVLLGVHDGRGRTATVLVLGALSGLLAEIGFVASEALGAEAARHASAPHRVQASLTGIDMGAGLAGPALGGLLLLAGPVPLLLSVTALALAASCLSPKQIGALTAPSRAGGGLRNGWRTLCSIPALLWLVGGLAASNAATGLVQAAAPIVVVERFDESAAHLGLVWTLAALASLGVVWAAQRLISRWGTWPVGAASAGLCTTGCVAVAVAPDFGSYAGAVAVMMAAEGGLTVVLRTLRARLIPASGFASTLSASIICVLVPLPVAGLVVGAVPSSHLGTVVAVCSLVQGLVLGGALWRLRTSDARATAAL